MNIESPHDAVNAFCKAWHTQNWQEMYFACQKTWQENNKDNIGTDWLNAWFGQRELKLWKILKIKKIGHACIDAEVKVKFLEDGREQKRRVDFRLICERAYKPDAEAGTWGCNPISVLKGL